MNCEKEKNLPNRLGVSISFSNVKKVLKENHDPQHQTLYLLHLSQRRLVKRLYVQWWRRRLEAFNNFRCYLFDRLVSIDIHLSLLFFSLPDIVPAQQLVCSITFIPPPLQQPQQQQSIVFILEQDFLLLLLDLEELAQFMIYLELSRLTLTG